MIGLHHKENTCPLPYPLMHLFNLGQIQDFENEWGPGNCKAHITLKTAFALGA